MKPSDAIMVLKKHNDNKRGYPVEIPDVRVFVEAIDTVVKELEKPTYTAEDMEAFAEWCSRKGWGYSYKDKEWSNMRPVYQIKTTTKLRELWENERGEE